MFNLNQSELLILINTQPNIFIIDNDQSYSAHSISFVNCSRLVITEIFKLINLAYPRECYQCKKLISDCSKTKEHYFRQVPYIIGECESINWYKNHTRTFQSWLDDFSFESKVNDINAAKLLANLVHILLPNKYIDDDFYI